MTSVAWLGSMLPPVVPESGCASRDVADDDHRTAFTTPGMP
jgi:hypothetical protein